MPTSEELAAQRETINDLRQQIDEERAAQAAAASDAASEAVSADLAAEQARLEAELALVRREGELAAQSNNALQAARDAMAAANAQREAIESAPLPGDVEQTTEPRSTQDPDQAEPPSDDVTSTDEGSLARLAADQAVADATGTGTAAGTPAASEPDTENTTPTGEGDGNDSTPKGDI